MGSTSAALLAGIKATLRARGMSYRELAKSVGVSHATIKRDLSRGRFSMRRLDEMCDALEVGLDDLLRQPHDLGLLTELTEEQEATLASNPRVLVVMYLVLNDWRFDEIVAAFEMNENQLIDILLRLDRLRIIDYRPPHRMRKLTARNFSWRKDGPVHRFFVERFVPEFFHSGFDGPSDGFRFVGGTLSAESAIRFKASVERLAGEFEELARRDARLPLEKRNGCSAILAVRSWEFSEFTRLRRRAAARS
jgi:DNA-binding Xre family transcriptional regulator